MSKVTVSHKAILAGLIAILLVAALLRFWNLPGKGLFYYDEAQMLAEGQFIASSVKLLPEAGRIALGPLSAGGSSFKETVDSLYHLFHDETRGSLPVLPRPSHTLLTGAAMLLLGERDYAGTMLSAFFGVLSVLLVFLLGKRMYNQRVGLVAAATLATSGYHIMYSRQALSEIDSTFFLILATYCYYMSCRPEARHPFRWLGLAGFLAGVAFTTNYRWTVIPLVFGAYELPYWLGWRSAALRTRAARLLSLGVFMLLPLLFSEMPYLLGRALAAGGLFKGLSTSSSYVGTLMVMSYTVGGERIGFRIPDASFPFLLWHFQGPVIFLLTLVGLYHIIRHRSQEDVILVVQFILPLVFYSLVLRPYARHVSLVLPIMALIVGRAFSQRSCLSNIRPPRGVAIPYQWVLLGATLAIVISGTWNSLGAVQMRSSYTQAIDFIKERNGDGRHISTHFAIPAFYLGWRSDRVKELPDSPQGLERLYEEGYRYLLVDYQLSQVEHNFSMWAYLRPQVLSQLRPIFSVENRIGGSLQAALEGNLNLASTMSYYANIPNNGAAVISVYDLADYFGG